MNAVLYYSNTGESKKTALHIAEALSFPIIEITPETERKYDTAVIVFPVYCQNIPKQVKEFLMISEIKRMSAVAVYGGICHGNVLYEIKTKYYNNMVAAAYIPTKHTYLDGRSFDAYGSIDPFLKKALTDTPATIPRSYKSPFASFFPGFRSRAGIKMIREESCVNCGKCTEICPEGAMENGKPNWKCIRCMKCAALCPKGALTFKPRFLMKQYLKLKKERDPEVFI